MPKAAVVARATVATIKAGRSFGASLAAAAGSRSSTAPAAPNDNASIRASVFSYPISGERPSTQTPIRKASASAATTKQNRSRPRALKTATTSGHTR